MEGPYPMRRLLILLSAVLLLAGCGHYVVVRHLVAPRNLPGVDLPYLSRMVIAMRIPPAERPAGILGSAVIGAARSAANRAISLDLPRLEAHRLLYGCGRTLSSRAGRVECCLIEGVSATSLIAAQRPTSVLWLKPLPVAARQSPVRQRGQDGGRSYHLTALFELEYELVTWPDSRRLARGRFAQGAESFSSRELELADWAERLEGMWESSLAGLRLDLLPAGVERSRLLRKGKSAGSREAYRAARRGDWERASGLWEPAAGEADAVAIWNLGIYSERLGRYGEAEAYYSRAREGAVKKRHRRALSLYIGELGQVQILSAAPNAGEEGWFDRPLAVLPFANASNDVSAPVRLRRLVHDDLQDRGYRLLPLTEIDRRLKDRGITVGGQLSALGSQELGQLFAEARTLLGNISEFKTVNVGLYNLNVVSLDLELRDSSGGNIWNATGHGFRETLIDPKESGKSFLFGLAESAVTKAARVYLEWESRTAVATGLETLPARPPGV